MTLTRHDLIQRANYSDRWHVLELTEYSSMFERDVLLQIFWNKNDAVQIIHERIVERINCFLAMDKSELDRIKNEIWKGYEIAVRVTDFGIVPQELYDKYNNSEETNREFFGHKNQEDTFHATKLNHIYFDDNIDMDHLYYMICFDILWDTEHGINMFCKDGRVESVE